MKKISTNISNQKLNPNKLNYNQTIISSNNKAYGNMNRNKIRNKKTFTTNSIQSNRSSFRII